MKIFNETTKYKFLSFTRYLGDGFFYPFLALYLRSRNLTESRIGFILSISPLLAILLNPIYSLICKNTKRMKNSLGIISMLEGIIIAIISLSSEFYLITALVLGMAIVGSCHYGMLDSLVAAYTEKENLNFQGIRIFGSIAYVIATTVGGIIIEKINFAYAFVIACALMVISGIIYLTLKVENTDTVKEKSSVKEYIEVFKNKELILFAIFYAIMYGTHYSTDYFFSTYLESRGIGADQFGMIYSFFVGVEVAALLVLNKIGRKISTKLLLLIASAALFIRLVINGLYLPLPLTIAFTALRGTGYACILSSMCLEVINIVGEEKSTKGIMLVTLAFSIYVFAFNNINGIIIENYSYKNFYYINAIIVFVMLIWSITMYIIYKKNKKLFI